MIVLDTQILVWAITNEPNPKCEDCHERAKQLVQRYADAKQPIIIPAIVLAEYLAGTSSERSRSILDIATKAYRIAPFDMVCAKVAADLYDKRIFDATLLGNRVSRDALKDDYKILATAIVHGGNQLYTSDPWIAKVDQSKASRNVKVLPLPNLCKSGTLDLVIKGRESMQQQSLLDAFGPETE